MPLGTEVGLGAGDFVFDGDPVPPEKKGTAPTQFLALVYCGQRAGWIKMPLGMEVNLGPGDVVLDGVAAPPKRGTAPQFQVHVLWPNCWIDEGATWYGSRLWACPSHIGLVGDAAPRKRGTAAPSFRLMSIVATVTHLSYC